MSETIESSRTIIEGSAEIILPEGRVFYNPVQIFNRDLSIAVINAFISIEKHRSSWILLEALSATGLRAIRYAKECQGISSIIANDLDMEAVSIIERNISQNNCSRIISSSQGDANVLMLQAANNKSFFDIIDLDPYGSAAPFLDSAVQAISNGGLLCVTCTDMAALCASYTDACLAKYGSIPTKGDICHEMALRIILNSIERSASKYRRSIEPLMSCSIDFYARVFVRVHQAKSSHLGQAPFKSCYLIRCPDCRSYTLQPMCRSKSGHGFKIGPSPLLSDSTCSYCLGNVQIAGPLWSGDLHSSEFLGVLKTSQLPDTITFKERVKGLAAICFEETGFPPLYISVTELAHTLRTPTPRLNQILYALKNAGYNVAISHCSPTGIKSNAPFSFFLAIYNSIVHVSVIYTM